MKGTTRGVPMRRVNIDSRRFKSVWTLPLWFVTISLITLLRPFFRLFPGLGTWSHVTIFFSMYISFDCPHLDSMPEYHLARPVILKPTRTGTWKIISCKSVILIHTTGWCCSVLSTYLFGRHASWKPRGLVHRVFWRTKSHRQFLVAFLVDILPTRLLIFPELLSLNPQNPRNPRNDFEWCSPAQSPYQALSLDHSRINP